MIKKLTRWLKKLWLTSKFYTICQDSGKCHYRNDWMSFYPGFYKWSFVIGDDGYGEDKIRIRFSILYGSFYISIPYKFKKKNYSGESIEYGFSFYSIEGWFPDNLILFYGRKSKFIHFPWELDWYRTSLLLKDNTWETEKKGDSKSFFDEKWNDKKFLEQYYYTYKPNGKERKIQRTVATISVYEREWRQRWLKWTKLFSRVKRVIDVEFAHEIGEMVGTYKGGTIGCSYEILPGETPEQTLKRMEKERRFS